MGRQRQRSRQQQRREQQRRQQQGQQQPERQPKGRPQTRGRTQQSGINWAVILPVVVVLAAIGVFVVAISGKGFAIAPTAPTPVPTTVSSQSLAPAIDGIKCPGGEMLSYHVHAHLTILDAGHQVIVPAYVGFRDNTCLYWLHTHDATGIIHIEAPHKFTPTLGQFFDVWGEPLSRTQAAGAKVGAGQQMKVFIGQTLYTGNPRSIPLHAHTTVTIEVGPPFSPPRPYNFPSGL